MRDDVTNLEVRSLINTFEKFAKADWRKQTKFGIKPSEIRLLVWVKEISQQNEHRVTVSEISKCLMVTSPTVTQMVKSLNHNGYLERCVDAHDRRVADIKLTAKGEDVVQQAIKHKVATYTGLIDSLGKDQTKQLISLLDQVYDYFDKVSKEN